jgi:hypothetical protein
MLLVAQIEILDGFTRDGTPTDLWSSMVQEHMGVAPPAAPKVITDAERGWAALIRSHRAGWETETVALAANFAPVQMPTAIRIVIGNQGAEDAFTHDATTIGFDLSKLHAIYGDASLAENGIRIDRFFRHEYTHLLQKAWLANHPYRRGRPVDAALLGIWTEGLGNYYSLSDRWRSANGQPSAAATEALARLTPRLVARMSALACVSADAQALLAGLSEGRFEEKWGALPAALWLDLEKSKSHDALQRFVVAGPPGVWDFLDRNLSGDSRAVLREARLAASLCAKPES